eukprot:Blabericola_migrator_1__11413@NODE_677_length_6914_cov_138_051994_g491_i0_p3_GENE_NODE_677_length_6914_cov_138_051994_g491_i0NODE_677_length_6914_cov_138_051994_g491_i0_p3_ORF_typecomplete_len215_score32_52NUDIX/PF00293_28/6e02NUDIX/PF00293_28/1_3e11_NODE_677_length_6914_cov_138_051994_g491_i060406684
MTDCEIKNIKVLAETKWIRVEELTYVDAHGRTRTWDRVMRTTTKDDRSPDAGVALTLAIKDGEPGIVCVVQFRPPIRQKCLEFPAGIIDQDEDPAQAIHRELKEETGYEGNALFVSPRLSLSPGIGCESVLLSLIYADPANPKNVTPEACPDEGEDLEVLFLPLKGLRTKLDELSTQGIMIFDAVYTFAIGLELAETIHGKAGPELDAVIKGMK